MKKQINGHITLYYNSRLLESRHYQSFQERLAILSEWKGKGTHYQITPEVDQLILNIYPLNKRARILLNDLNK